jgi:GTPase SAR1 and related small G proteins
MLETNSPDDSSAESPTKEQNLYRYLVLGDSESGKTTLLDYYCSGERPKRSMKKTKGCEIHSKQVLIQTEECSFKKYAEFWDLGGDETYRPYLDIYLREFHNRRDLFKGIIYIFDASVMKTVRSITKHLNELSNIKCQSKSAEKIPLLIIGNKFDKISKRSMSSTILKIKHYLAKLFEDQHIMCTFLSVKEPYSQFKELNKFIEDTILGNVQNHFLFDSQFPLEYTKKIQKYAGEKIGIIKEDVKRFTYNLTRKAFYLYTFVTASFFCESKNA